MIGYFACYFKQLLASADWYQSCRSSNVQKKYFQRENWWWRCDGLDSHSAALVKSERDFLCIFQIHFLCRDRYPNFSFLFFWLCWQLTVYFVEKESKKLNRLLVRIKLIYICKLRLGHLLYFSLNSLAYSNLALLVQIRLGNVNLRRHGFC